MVLGIMVEELSSEEEEEDWRETRGRLCDVERGGGEVTRGEAEGESEGDDSLESWEIGEEFTGS